MTERTSRTSRWSALLAASALAVMHPGIAPAEPGDTMHGRIEHQGKAGHQCGGGIGAETGLYRSCDEFPVSLPMTFRYNPAGSPVSSGDFIDALDGAADAWNHPLGFGTPSFAGEVLAIGGTTTRVKAKDGTNTVLWGDPASCGLPGALAVACFWYAGETGAARHQIVEVDIILNSGDTWRQASSIENLPGTASGNAALATAAWIDVQSTITHEFGHALGLEHVGVGSFSDLTDVGKHMQTMYPVDWRGSTAKRTIELGDMLGLRYIFENSG